MKEIFNVIKKVFVIIDWSSDGHGSDAGIAHHDRVGHEKVRRLRRLGPELQDSP